MYIGLGGARFAPRGRLPADCKVLIILAKDLGDLRFTVAKCNALNFGRVFWIYRGVAKGGGSWRYWDPQSNPTKNYYG